ncbi:hypothetical protein [Inhella sp.]|uniref:hypothetical protein n=1 Tax=Inhella sp. TaxID=1921806 RepID=UPI0035AE9D23
MKARRLLAGALLSVLLTIGFLLLIRTRNLAGHGEEVADQTLGWFIVGMPAIPCLAFGLVAYLWDRAPSHLVTVGTSMTFALLAFLSTEAHWLKPIDLWQLSASWRDVLITAYFVLLAASAPMGAWLGWWVGRRSLGRGG